LLDYSFWRYSRQLALLDIGLDGQEKLSKSRVAVVGLGGLGSQVAMSLAATGVGYMRLIDFDVVSTPDLHRQLIYSESDVGYAKAEAAANRIKSINSAVETQAVCEYVDEKSAQHLLGDVDLVVDCADSFSTKYAVNRACAKLRKPFVFGSAIGYYGNVATFEPWREVCLECLYPGLSDDDYPTCAVAGVLPQCVQTVGSIQAAEALRCLLGSPSLVGSLLFVDMRAYTLDRIQVAPNPRCPLKEGTALTEPKVGEPREVCSRNGRRQLLLVLDTRPTPSTVYSVFSGLGHARLKGGWVVELRDQDGLYAYTGAGILLGEVDSQLDVDHAKLKLSKLGEAIQRGSPTQ
jgi:molybdopterin/thiamine biosynthesis adenylyltransferase